ncbi:MAG TPA: type IX secretion system membrane protein PorP/SprF [Flavobacteriales bacterium]|nr:type IX secretion system membrane protein PorP/SprF [Flavobacteriales bacterium]
MNFKKLSIILILSLLITGMLYAQDIHFSQFYRTPLLINPALTGTFTGNHRAYINYRNQWKSVGTPYKTFAFAYDMPFYRKKWKGGYLGAGLFAFNDNAGTNNLSTTQINLSLSGIVLINAQQKISAAIQGGLTQMSINYGKAIWGNQFQNHSYNANNPSGELNLNREPVYNGDINAGLSWRYAKNETNISSKDQLSATAGFAIFHINQPKQNLFSGQVDRLYTKYAIHASANIGLKGLNSFFVPSLIFYRQGKTTEFTAGTLIRYRIKEESRYTGFIKESSISLGLHYRHLDAMIPSVIIDVSGFSVGISYDINISPLTKASSGRGGIEISLKFINPSPYKFRNSKSAKPML